MSELIPLIVSVHVHNQWLTSPFGYQAQYFEATGGVGIMMEDIDVPPNTPVEDCHFHVAVKLARKYDATVVVISTGPLEDHWKMHLYFNNRDDMLVWRLRNAEKDWMSVMMYRYQNPDFG